MAAESEILKELEEFTDPTGEIAQTIIAAHMKAVDETICALCSDMMNTLRDLCIYMGTAPEETQCLYCGTEFTPYPGYELITCPKCEKVQHV